MKPRPHFIPIYRQLLLLLFAVLLMASHSMGQCNNWSISADLISSSSCAGNGSFSVALSGADVSNLTNIQYGISLSANGFSVPLNNAATFNSIPAGTYQVSAVATCGDSIVGKNTNITIPGNYAVPQITANSIRGSLDCGAYGRAAVAIHHGVGPYTIHLISTPAGYTGSTSFVSTDTNYVLTNLYAGTYQIQVTDACGSGTNIYPVTINSLDISALELELDISQVINYNCDTLILQTPLLDIINSGNDWIGYEGDSVLKVSAQVDGVPIAATPFISLDISSINIPLPTGVHIKDFYGKTITFTVESPCGTIQRSKTIPYPYFLNSTIQNCNTDFTDLLQFEGAVCYPVTYTFQNIANGESYGPYTATGSYTTPPLPIGYYVLTYTTADGFASALNTGVSNITGNPYSVSIEGGVWGLNNYIYDFHFSTSNPLGSPVTVELFSGPAGYSYHGIWPGGSDFIVSDNQTPTQYGTLLFPAGNYVWKITDSCGSYLLPITVGDPDLYQYTVGIGHERQTCQGLWVTPYGTANNGQSMPFYYAVMENGVPVTNNNSWVEHALGDSFLVTTPGTYIIVPSSSNLTLMVDSGNFGYTLPYPNVYTATYSFTYTVGAVGLDLDSSEGFICAGGAGQASIYATGMGGIPFKSPSQHYIYSLAQQGSGATGPYLATNTTGIFTNFNGSANQIYDVKVTDSCGAYSVQPIKILDLATANLISSSSYVTCAQDSVQLTAAFLPNATYSWTGPDGFSSTLRNPVIYNVTPQMIGVYHLTVTTSQCDQVITDSTTLTMSANPPKPVVSYNCDTIPVQMIVTNPTSGIQYQWSADLEVYGSFLVPDYGTGDTQMAYEPGIYNAIAVDTTTGCTTSSDSIIFGTYPGAPFNATIYSPHLTICTGDTTILVAQGAFSLATYQWFENGSVIPGATNSSYVAAAAGSYKVSIDAGPCQKDTSAAVTVTVSPPPTASITAPIQNVCAGDTAFINANTGAGYTYTWYCNNNTVPGFTGATLGATQAGTYYVIVSNGGCIATSGTVNITLSPGPNVNITPNTLQTICNGSSVNLSTPYDNSYSYTWQRNGSTISAANTNTYNATTSGAYDVRVSTAVCPPVTSAQVTVDVLTAPTAFISTLTPDICDGGSAAIADASDPGCTYIWYQDNAPIEGATNPSYNATQTGSYYVIVSNGVCSTTSNTINITVHPAPVADLSPNSDQSICPGQAIDFIVGTTDPSFTYSWKLNGAPISDATGNAFSATSGGIYQVTISSPYCPSAISPQVAVSVLPNSVSLRSDTTICNDVAIAIPLSTGAGFSQILWSTGETTQQITATTSGTYWVSATNQCGTFSDTMHIYTPADYAIKLPVDTTVCNATNKAQLSVPAILQNIQWSTGDTTASVMIDHPGIYWVQAQSPCSMEYDTMNVTFCKPVIQQIELQSDTICAGDCIEPMAIVANYPLQYYWSFNGATPDTSTGAATGFICYRDSGTYPISLIVTNVGGADTAAIQIVVAGKPIPRFADTSVTVKYKTDVTLPACATAQHVTWYKGNELICDNCDSIIVEGIDFYSTYHCVVSNGGCVDSCNYQLEVVDIPHDVWLPDAFTPNQDGRNDYFHVITDNPNIEVSDLTVYNRWGQEVFKSGLSNKGWDGTINGIPASMDTYFWMLRYKVLGSDEVYLKKGNVTLVR